MALRFNNENLATQVGFFKINGREFKNNQFWSQIRSKLLKKTFEMYFI